MAARSSKPNPPVEVADDKEKAIKNTISQLERQFGTGSVMRMGDKPKVNIDTIPSGSLGLDLATGIGGFPRGRVVEVYGPESSGKTTLALHVVANAQKTGGYAAFVDAEHALDPAYARKLGVDVDNLLISQPDTGEQALEITEALVRSGAMDIVVVDSVAALVPRAELEGEMGDAHVGLQARLMSQALRKLTAAISKSNTCVVFINQIRMKIGVMYGSPETTAGGTALKFYSSMRMEIRKVDSIKKGDEIIGNRVRVKVVKNKLAPPFKMIMFDLYFNEGISKENELLDIGSDNEIVSRSGAWYSYEEERLGQGRENSRAFLLENPDIAAIIKTKIFEKFGVGEVVISEDRSAEE